MQHSFLFNNIEMFDFPHCIYDFYGKGCELYVNNVLSQIEEYKKSPEYVFHLTSFAKERNHFGLGILLGFALWLIFAWSGYIDTEEYKKQRKKKKRKNK